MNFAATMCSGRLSPALGADDLHVWHFAYRREQGRMPLLDVLACYLGVAPAAVHLIEGEHGRPRLANAVDPTLDFNWSHCADHAAVAVARGLVPGIDIELLGERTNALRLAQRYFHPAETAALVAMPAAARSAAFLELWTAKEAVLKAIGRGLAFGLHRLNVAPAASPRLLALEGDDIAAWQLQRLPLDGRHVAALAWRGGQRRIVIRALDPWDRPHAEAAPCQHAQDDRASSTQERAPTLKNRLT